MFITFEGIEGSGKSLQIARAHTYLRQKNIACLATREPGGTGFGISVRRVLLETGGCQREPICELLLLLADRCQHLKEVIVPALQKGITVLSDRYHDATRAYQGGARGIPDGEIEKLARLLGIIEPDKTILLDMAPEEGLSRARLRNKTVLSAGAEGRFEEEAMSFHKDVREAYLRLAKRSPERIHIVEASGTPDEVFSRIEPLLNEWLLSSRPS
jgi:dTMP kinase